MSNILLGVTGSIAAYKACDIIRALTKAGHSVRCVMSKDAGNFITALTLETLSGKKAISGMFVQSGERVPEHISLADEADAILVAPATADVIGKIASGICDEILTCTICASNSPVIFAPAMNDKMFKNPIVQDKIRYLKEKGYFFVPPVKGKLACGTEGVGHIAPVGDILEHVQKHIKN